VAIDFIGPLPEDQGINSIITFTDRLGSDIQLVPSRTDITAKNWCTFSLIDGTVRMDCHQKSCQAPRKSPWRLVPKIGHFLVFCLSHFWQNLSKLHLTFANFSKNCPDFRNRPSGCPKHVWTSGFGLLRAQNFYTGNLHDPMSQGVILEDNATVAQLRAIFLS